MKIIPGWKPIYDVRGNVMCEVLVGTTPEEKALADFKTEMIMAITYIFCEPAHGAGR